jgi:hypothetical protein
VNKVLCAGERRIGSHRVIEGLLNIERIDAEIMAFTQNENASHADPVLKTSLLGWDGRES